MAWDKFSTCGWAFVKAIYFILASFIFSFIFWGTKRWMDESAKKKKKKFLWFRRK